MSSSSLSPDDIRAAAETHRDLGPDYQDAVIESFLDKVGKEIDARVDARMALARQSPAAPPVPAHSEAHALRLAIVSMVLGIPLTGISVAFRGDAQLAGLAVIWLAIAAINIAYAVRLRPPPSR